jgi:hypothetical protein
MLTLNGYRTTSNQIGKSPFAWDEVELTFTVGQGGWVNINTKKCAWGYHPGEGRWSYGTAPSADADVVAQIAAAVREWLATPVPAGTVAPSRRPRVEAVTGIPLDEHGEY